MKRLAATALALAALAFLASASEGLASGTAGYKSAATQACLVHAGLNISVEPKVSPTLQHLEPYGSLGGLIWKDAGDVHVLIEFGKSPAEAAAMFNTIVKLFGHSAASGAAVTKNNVMFYTNHLKLTSHETSTVSGCLH